MEFLQFSGLVILNSIFCKGAPTYEIAGKKRSIINLCLTNSPDLIHHFEVEPTPFGVNSQTCHRALETTIIVNRPKRVSIPVKRRIAYGRLSKKKQMRIVAEVSSKLVELQNSGSSPDYFQLTKVFSAVKQRFLGIRDTIRSTTPLSPTMRNLQKKFYRAIDNLKKYKTPFSIFVADNIEKLLCSQYKKEKNNRFSIWLRKMNDLDFQNRTRTFFAEIRKKHSVKVESGPIYNRNGIRSESLNSTLNNRAE